MLNAKLLVVGSWSAHPRQCSKYIYDLGERFGKTNAATGIRNHISIAGVFMVRPVREGEILVFDCFFSALIPRGTPVIAYSNLAFQYYGGIY